MNRSGVGNSSGRLIPAVRSSPWTAAHLTIPPSVMASSPPSARIRPPIRRLAIGLLVLLATLLFAGCGSDDSEIDPGNAADAPSYTKMTESAPPKLAGLYAAGGTLIEGGSDAFRAQVEALEGYPIVINKWASWCGPCREEFPYFQQEAADRGDRGRVPRHQLERLQRRGRDLPPRPPGPLPELLRPGRGDRQRGGRLARVPLDDLLQRGRREDLRAPRPLHLPGRPRRRHRPLRRQRLSARRAAARVAAIIPGS